MKLTVDYYRGVKHADIEIEGISLIAGTNFQGKSSVADALGSILTGECLPEYVLKKDSKDMVNSNSGVGKILLENQDATGLIDYPIAKFTGAGILPKCSFESAGMKSPVLIETERDRASYFGELLKTNPMKSDLKKAVEKANMDDDSFAELWKLVESLSWDGAYQRTKSRGIELKGAWKHITAEQYGINKGEIWKPEGWILGLEGDIIEAIRKEIDKLQKERDKAVSSTAINEEEKKKLRSFVDGIASARMNTEEHQKVVDDSQEAYNQHIADVPTILTNDYQACPKCGDALKIEDGKIVVAKKLTKKQIDASQKIYDKHRDNEKKLQEALSLATEGLATAKSLLKECEEAVEKWNKVSEKSEGRTAEIIDVDIEQLENKSIMLESYIEARNVHNDILAMAVVVEALSPEGLRKKLLKTGILKFNVRLNEICKEAWFMSMSVDPDNLTFSMAGRRYQLLSKSEQYRLRVAVQLTIACYDESEVIIIDGVDILDNKGRSGLLNVLHNEIQKTALICMTIITGKEDMRDMSDVGGHSYWIEEGEIK